MSNSKPKVEEAVRGILELLEPLDEFQQERAIDSVRVAIGVLELVEEEMVVSAPKTPRGTLINAVKALIVANPNGIISRDIAKNIDCDPASLSSILSRLAKLKLVKKQGVGPLAKVTPTPLLQQQIPSN